MGHILLIILKIIGWILLIILGLIILLILTVLFTSVRYEVDAQSEGKLETTSGSAKISVFFRMIKFFVRYDQDGLVWNGRIAWKKLGNNIEEPKEEMIEASAEYESKMPIEPLGEEESEITAETVIEEEPKVTVETAIKEEPKITAKAAVEEAPKVTVEATADEEKARKKFSKHKKLKKKKKPEKASEKHKQNQKKIDRASFEQKIKAFAEKLMKRYLVLRKKLEAFDSKKKLAMDFIEDEDHQNALNKFWKELKRFLKKAVPRKLSGTIEFGFEDPSWTGKVLGLISMLYPVFPGELNVNPNFQEKTLSGDIFIKGRFRLSFVASFAIHLLLNKSVRKTIRHILKIAKRIKGGK